LIAWRAVSHSPALALALLAVACATPHVVPPADAELPLTDFFVRPVGPRGLEPSPTLLALRGKRVSVRGYMVAEEEPYPGFFMLAQAPVALAERADGPADDLPPATLYVHLPADQRWSTVGFVPGPLELTGTLELGAEEELSGRISYVRLQLDD